MTARPGKSTGWWLSKGQRGRRAHHELNTTDLGDTRRSEGRLWRQDKPHHPLNSRVKGHAIAQTTAPTGSRCWCNKRGRGGGGRLERSRVCHFPLRHPFQYFSAQWWWQFDPTSAQCLLHSAASPCAAWDVRSLLCVLWKVSLETVVSRKQTHWSSTRASPGWHHYNRWAASLLWAPPRIHRPSIAPFQGQKGCDHDKIYGRHRGQLKLRLLEEVCLEDPECKLNSVKVTSAWCILIARGALCSSASQRAVMGHFQFQ